MVPVPGLNNIKASIYYKEQYTTIYTTKNNICVCWAHTNIYLNRNENTGINKATINIPSKGHNKYSIIHNYSIQDHHHNNLKTVVNIVYNTCWAAPAFQLK